MEERIRHYINSSSQIEPLVVFRIAFGLLMSIAAIRFMANGWVTSQYLGNEFQFKYYGFDWVQALSIEGMYAVEIIKVICGICIALGLFYRPAIVLFFLLFTYTELIDKTFYLNHYYFVSIISFLMIFLPANRKFALDQKVLNLQQADHVPSWTIDVLKLQLLLVYFFAGLAKINTDWLLNAMPLKLWLPARYDLPIIGELLRQEFVAYLFSWTGMLFDLCIGFLLWSKTFRKPAYIAVLIFHCITALLFPIGMFPFIMICSTLIFFNADEYHPFIHNFPSIFGINLNKQQLRSRLRFSPLFTTMTLAILALHFLVQIVLPLRHSLYPGNTLWNEEGFRFSWRVMLVEKAGAATFYVKRSADDQYGLVDNRDFLSPVQEKQMAFQPDMILEYAHYLKTHFESLGMESPEIKAEVYVSMNGRPSKLLVDPTVDLTKHQASLAPKNWVLPLEE